MINVLQPFEVGAGNAAAVHQKIWGYDNAASGQNLLSTERSRPISTFEDHLALETACVFLVDGLFSGSRDEDVAFVRHEVSWTVGGCCSVGIVEECSMLGHVLFHVFRVETVRIGNG